MSIIQDDSDYTHLLYFALVPYVIKCGYSGILNLSTGTALTHWYIVIDYINSNQIKGKLSIEFKNSSIYKIKFEDRIPVYSSF